MKWQKCGKICDNKSFDLDWFKLNATCPVPYRYDDDTIRVYVTFCDEKNIGRIGYIDVNVNDPGQIKKYSKEPVLDVGEPGRFDDNGVLTASLFVEDEVIYLVYSGYELHVQHPYTVFTGLAVSVDGGESFKRQHDVPLLDRVDGELFIRSAAEIIGLKENKYRVFYSSASAWIGREGNYLAPKYELKYIDSPFLEKITGEGKTAISLKNDEHGLTTPQIIKTENGFGMFYSIRSISKGYRLGYAESKDCVNWVRMDDKMQIDVSETGWDSEMICFGKTITVNDNTYLFYCGNHYGQGGLGYAKLIQ